MTQKKKFYLQKTKCMELERINEACKVCIEELSELDEVIAQIGK